jgi:DNA-binding transcriptional regulator YiaG
MKKENKFGERLMIARMLSRRTQESCAAELGVASSTWRNWERGRTDPHNSIKKLIKQVLPAFENQT